MNFSICPKRVFRVLLVAIVVLLIAQVGVIYLKLNRPDGFFEMVIKLFDVNKEKNIPTFFSSLLLLCSGVLFGAITLNQRRLGKSYGYWLGLTMLFVFLSLDEMISIHEQLRYPVHEYFNTSGLLYYGWFIPYLFVLGFMTLFYINFMRLLPKVFVSRFVVAALVYGSGAVGLEAVSGWYHELMGENDNLTYYTISAFEEALEMIGAALFVYACLRLITYRYKTIKVHLNTDEHANERYFDFSISEVPSEPKVSNQ